MDARKNGAREGDTRDFVARPVLSSILESLGNDDGDANENGKKAIGLDSQNNDSVRASHVFVNFLTVTARVQRAKCLISRYVEDMNTRQRLPFSFPELRYSL